MNITSVMHFESIGINGLPKFKADIIICTNSPKVNLNRVISLLEPEIILADGSSDRSYISNWKAA